MATQAMLPVETFTERENELLAFNGNAGKIFDLIDVSEATRKDYKSRLPYFLAFIAGHGLSVDTYLSFKRTLAERSDFAVSTKNKYLITAKVFLKELYKRGQIPTDITANVKLFRQSRKHKKEGLNPDEVKALFGSPALQHDSRVKTIFVLLALQGLRQIEISRLDFADIDFVNGTVLIQGKGQDDKELVYLQPETVKAIKVYVKEYKIAAGALFCSQSNNSKSQRLTVRSIRRIIKRLFKLLGIDKVVHGLRHFFTTELIKTYKGELLEVARYTRHRNLDMLQVYNDAINHKADLPRFYSVFESYA